MTAVSAELTRRGMHSCIFSRHDRHARISLRLNDAEYRVSFEADGQSFNGSDVTGIWWRQKPFSFFYPDNPRRNDFQTFAGKEWHALLPALESILDEDLWLNRPSRQTVANLKPLQLRWAAASGFRVPPTCFTNDWREVNTFSLDEGDVVYKTFSGHVFQDATAIFTTSVSRRLMAEDEDAVGIAPGIYQRLLRKSFELRAYFCDSEVLACRINSQCTDATRLDWRKDQEVNIYEMFESSSNLKEQILSYSERADLRFGALDLVVDEIGEVFFLECNPAGQWLWIEELIEFPVTAAVCDSLATESR